MTVREVSREHAVYHIEGRSPQQMLHGIAAHLKSQPKYMPIELATAVKLPRRISEINKYGKIEGSIFALRNRMDGEPKNYLLKYIVMHDMTELVGGSESLAEVTKRTAERLDELAERF